MHTTDGPEDGTSWYLINCIAGVEKDLLNQIRYVCEQKGFPITDVEKFVVPTERHLRSHGDKKKVVDVKVRYPGYVFCKIRLIEDVYETLQELELARSWMGTVNKKGHKKLPPAPLPLNDDEVKKFKGLEEAQELFEDMFGNDYSGRTDTGADLLAQYEGYDVGQMVKILRGNFDGEDGTIRRLKGGQLMVRLFTYGQVFDEWFDPDAIRPLSDLEVMRGMSGPTVAIDQDQFDVSIGKKDPTTLEGPAGGNMPERSGLMQNAGSGPERNRREDRVARGETGSRDMLGRTPAEMKTEEQNWLAYREEQRAGQRGGVSDTSMPAVEAEPVMKREPFRPPKGSKGDTWCVLPFYFKYLLRVAVFRLLNLHTLLHSDFKGGSPHVVLGMAENMVSKPIPNKRRENARIAQPRLTKVVCQQDVAVEMKGIHPLAVAETLATDVSATQGSAVLSVIVMIGKIVGPNRPHPKLMMTVPITRMIFSIR